jgi:tripartite-type tricarboxylate transporter receptor subunit TctC
MRDNLSYDAERDFSPITMVSATPSMVVVHPSLGVKSIRELIALAKARPGEINYSAGTAGSPPHLAGELFKSMAGINIVLIPYRGTGPAMAAIMGGQVQLGFPTASGAAPHVKANRLRALALTSAQPSAIYPNIPTVADSGLPGYESVTILGLFAPGKTPPAIINRLNQEVVRFLKTPEAQAQFVNSGTEPASTTPEEFAGIIKSDATRMGKVIKEAGIHLE